MRTRRLLLLSLSMTGRAACWRRRPCPLAAAARPRRAPKRPTSSATSSRSSPPPASAATARRKQKGKLRLDTREGMLAGGESAPVRRRPATGRAACSTSGSSRPIPTSACRGARARCPAAEIETVRRWIEAGAPWPAGVVVGRPVASAAVTAPARGRGPAVRASPSTGRAADPRRQLLRLPRPRPQPPARPGLRLDRRGGRPRRRCPPVPSRSSPGASREERAPRARHRPRRAAADAATSRAASRG